MPTLEEKIQRKEQIVEKGEKLWAMSRAERRAVGIRWTKQRLAYNLSAWCSELGDLWEEKEVES